MDKFEKIDKILELINQGKSRDEVAKEFGYSNINSLSKFMKRNGYKTENGKYILEDNSCKTSVMQKEDVKQKENSCNTESNKYKTNVSQDEYRETIEYLHQNIDKIKKILENKNLEKSKKININIDTLEKAEQSNFRVYSSIRSDFKRFCEQHKEYKVQDLVSQALKDFMDNYKKE